MVELEQESFEDFLKWAAELGITDSTRNNRQSEEISSSCLGHRLCVAYFAEAGGRGLGAVNDLRKGELILTVPKSALMTRESLTEDYKLRLAVKMHTYLSANQILAVCLLYEVAKGKYSKWQPYLMHLPRTYDILATFGNFEKQSLQVDEAKWVTENAVLRSQSAWKEASTLMKDLALDPQFLTLKAWIWAAATISSRTLHIPWDEAGCLCPVGDLFNYAAPGQNQKDVGNLGIQMPDPCSSCMITSLNGDNTTVGDVDFGDSLFQRLTDGGFEEDVDAYCFYARDSYKKGEQALLCYGTYTNLELLEHYGFILDGNPNDKLFIPLEPSMYSSTSWPTDSLYINYNGKPSFSLLCTLRLWATPHNKRRSVGNLAYSGCQLSVENETSVMKWLLKNCAALLKKLPTSVEEDSWLFSAINSIQDVSVLLKLKNVQTLNDEICGFLEANNLSDKVGAELQLSRKAKRSIDKWKLAVQWRLSYKRILLACISYCTETISSLEKISSLHFRDRME